MIDSTLEIASITFDGHTENKSEIRFAVYQPDIWILKSVVRTFLAIISMYGVSRFGTFFRMRRLILSFANAQDGEVEYTVGVCDFRG